MAVPKLKYGIGNSASTTSTGSITNSDTSVSLTADTNFNAKSGEGTVLLEEGAATEEIAYATGKSGSTLAIPLANRGLEGGSAQPHTGNFSIKGVITVGMWNDLIDSILNLLDQATGAIKSGITFASAILTSPTITTSIKVRGVYALGNLTGAVTIDPANGDRQYGTLTGNVTGITLTAPANNDPTVLTLYLMQDGTGGRTIAWTTSVVWQDGSTWTSGTSYTTTASKLNTVVLFFNGSAWFGMTGKFA